MQASEPARGLAAWRAQIAACRADRPKGESSHWQRIAAWYDHWVQSNGYVQQLWPRLEPLVGPSANVLEIGPGTGAYTIPLAGVARHLTAIEPSEGMRRVLQQKAAEQGLSNLSLVPHRIEDAIGTLEGPFDLALASHSLYNVMEIDDVLRFLLTHVRRSMILMGTGYQQEWLRSLHLAFRGGEPVSPGSWVQFSQVLDEMEIDADIEILYTSANYVFDSEDALVAWWTERIAPAPDDRSALRKRLLALAEQRSGSVGIYGQQRVALIQMDGKPRGDSGCR